MSDESVVSCRDHLARAGSDAAWRWARRMPVSVPTFFVTKGFLTGNANVEDVYASANQ